MKARTTIKKILTMAGLAVSMGMASTAMTQVDFEPFSEVENVCPDCKKMKADTVELTSGESLQCTIVAENDDFLVVERFGEIRGVSKRKVKTKSFQDGNGPSNLRSQDQIVLKNGHILTGEIVDESDKPGHFQLKSSIGDFSYVVFKKEAKALYRNGSKKTIEMPEDGGAAPSSNSAAESNDRSDASDGDFQDTGGSVDSPDF